VVFPQDNFEPAFSSLRSLDECSWIDVAVRARKYLVSTGVVISVKLVIEFKAQGLSETSLGAFRWAGDEHTGDVWSGL
jgi:hypothetical protein